MDKFNVIINPDSTFGGKAEHFFRNIGVGYKLNTSKDDISSMIESGRKEIIICGGDGTVNNFLNSYMSLPKTKRDKMRVGFIPSGKANDLAIMLGMTTDIQTAYNKITDKKVRTIDVIRVNDKYFVTGGGFGLSSDVIKGVNSFSNKKVGRLINRHAKDYVYYYHVLKKIMFGYEGIKLEGDEHMIIAVMNQPFIGKRFMLSPESVNDDGMFEVCYLKKPDGFFANYRVVKDVIAGVDKSPKVKTKGITLNLDRKVDFMADGELLCSDKKFEVEIVRGGLKVYY